MYQLNGGITLDIRKELEKVIDTRNISDEEVNRLWNEWKKVA